MRHLLLCGIAALLVACGGGAVADHAIANSDMVADRAAAPIATPPLRGRVMDEAAILSPQAEARLATLSSALERRTSDQLVVVTLPGLGGHSIEEVGLALGRTWRVGQAGKDNGVLLIVARPERKVRIEVGCGLEPILTNARARQIIDRAIVPAFSSADFDRGTEAGARAIAATLTAAADTPRVAGCRT